MAKRAPTFACRECGETFLKWIGRCPACSTMNSVAEISVGEAALAARSEGQARAASTLAVETIDAAKRLGEVQATARTPQLIAVDRASGAVLKRWQGELPLDEIAAWLTQ